VDGAWVHHDRIGQRIGLTCAVVGARAVVHLARALVAVLGTW
jgi:hypothetical protein